MKQKMEEALNGQFSMEVYSANLYLAMSAYLESKDLPGAASWMKVQYKEELDHALKLFNYVIARDGRATVAEVEAPPSEWESPLSAFVSAYKHEQMITAAFVKLVKLAREEQDPATENFLQWFVNEQVEEESSVKRIVQNLKRVGETGNGLFLIDRELGARVYTPLV